MGPSARTSTWLDPALLPSGCPADAFGIHDDVQQVEIQRVPEAHWADNPTCPSAAGDG